MFAAFFMPREVLALLSPKHLDIAARSFYKPQPEASSSALCLLFVDGISAFICWSRKSRKQGGVLDQQAQSCQASVTLFCVSKITWDHWYGIYTLHQGCTQEEVVT
jgi:hypothetical protein